MKGEREGGGERGRGDGWKIFFPTYIDFMFVEQMIKRTLNYKFNLKCFL